MEQKDVPATGQFGAEDVEISEHRIAFQGHYRIEQFALRHRCFGGGWSALLHREMLERGTAAGLLPYDPVRDTVVLVEQFRIGPYGQKDQPWMVEIVAGLIDSGETPENVARREAQEEAGLAVRRVEPVAAYYPSPGVSSEFVTIFCGEVDSAEAPALAGLVDEGEDIRIRVWDWNEIVAGIETGLFRNAATLIALQWLQFHRERLRQLWLEKAR
jgi:ADP-ribose pyrophosphatase